MRAFYENAFGDIVVYSKLTNLYKYTSRTNCVIIIYHRILNDNEFRNRKNGVWVDHFLRQMSFLASNYHCISLRVLGEHLQQKRHLPENAVVITFDDGYLDNYAFAYPILKSLKLPATFFVCPGMIDSHKVYWWDLLDELIAKSRMRCIVYRDKKIFLRNDSERAKAKKYFQHFILREEHNSAAILNELQSILNVGDELTEIPGLMNWEQLDELRANGMEIGAHTMTHNSLGHFAFTNGTGDEQIRMSKKQIEHCLGAPVKSFAFPYGSEEHIDSRACDALREAGFELAVSGIVGTTDFDDDIFRLPRVAIQSYDNFALFKTKISGIYPRLYRKLRNALRACNGS